MAPRNKKSSQDGDEDYLPNAYEEESSESGEELTTERKKWTPEEDRILLEKREEFKHLGHAMWLEIASFLPGRSNKHCYFRFVYHLDPSLKKGDWTEEEEATLIELRGQKERWVDIGKELGGRSPKEVQNHWNSMGIQEKLRQNGNKSNNNKKKNNRNKGASGGVNNQTEGRVGRGKSDGSSRRSRRSRERLDEEDEEEAGNEANQNDDDEDGEEGDDADEEEEQEDDDDEEEEEVKNKRGGRSRSKRRRTRRSHQPSDDDDEEEVENERGWRRGSKRRTRRSQQQSDEKEEEEVENKRGERSGSKRRTRRSQQQSDEEQEEEVDNGVKQDYDDEEEGLVPVKQEDGVAIIEVLDEPDPFLIQALTPRRLNRLLRENFTIYFREAEDSSFTQVRFSRLICKDEDGNLLLDDFSKFLVIALRKVLETPDASLNDFQICLLYHDTNNDRVKVTDNDALENAIVDHLLAGEDSKFKLDVRIRRKNNVPAAVVPRAAAAAAALPASTGAPPIDHPARSFSTPGYDTPTVNAAAGGPLINERAERPGEDDSMDDDALHGSASSATHAVPAAFTSPVASVPFNPNAPQINDPARVAWSGEDCSSDGDALTRPKARCTSVEQPDEVDSSDDEESLRQCLASMYPAVAPAPADKAHNAGQGMKRKIDEKSSDTPKGASGKRGKPS